MLPDNFNAILLFFFNFVWIFIGISRAQVWWNTFAPSNDDGVLYTTPNPLSNATDYSTILKRNDDIIVGPHLVPRDKCIVVFHVEPEDDLSLKDRVLYIFQTIMECDILEKDVEAAYRISKNPDYSVPVFVVLRNPMLKHILFKNAKKLAGKDYKIGNCMSKDEVRGMRVMRQFLIKARIESKRAKMSGHKLQIEDEKWKLDELLDNKSPIKFDAAAIDNYRKYIDGEAEMF